MRRSILPIALLALVFTPAPSNAQLVGASLELGTLGVGGRLAVSLGDQFRLRGGADFQPFPIEVTPEDVAYDLTLATPSITALLDWQVGGSGFRLSGGMIFFVNELELEAEPKEPVTIGGQEYQPQQIGSLVGNLGTEQVAPYFGIGWGDSTRTGITFSLDLGAAFHGTPEADLRATGPIGDDPGFQANLADELAEVNDEIEVFTAYPVLSIGIGFGL